MSTHESRGIEISCACYRPARKTLGVILNIVTRKAELATAYEYGYSYG